MKIAICGKGGVGKTTICAILSQLLGKDGYDVLAIDADSNPTLGMALGLGGEGNPQPLIEMKQLIEDRTGAKAGSVGSYFKLNPEVSDLPGKYSVEVGGVKLLVLGGIEEPGRGCACPEGSFLKALLSYTILGRQEVILVDLAAGVEFLGRACVDGVDALIVVVEPGTGSIKTALSIAQMAGKMGIAYIAAFANKISEASQIEIIKSQLGDIEVLGSFGYEPSLQAADLKGLPIISASSELVGELQKVKEAILKLLLRDHTQWV